MKGATKIIVTSPQGAVEYFDGVALRVEMQAGNSHWTIHEIQHGNTEMAIVGIVPKDWVIRLHLP